MLCRETVGRAKPHDVIDVITESVHLVCCHIELFDVFVVMRVLLALGTNTYLLIR